MEKNLGVLIAPPRPKDYLLGSASSITVNRNVKDWSIYLPARENQRNSITDFLDCVSMSMLHSVEMQLNYLLKELPDEALNFFTNNNYLLNGSFELSARFNAKVNGTDKTMGQYLNIAADSLRSAGFIPKSDWDMTDDMSFVEYYRDIPIGLFAKAKKSLWFIDVKYQWIGKSDFPIVIPISPIQIASHTCPGWDSGQTVPMCADAALNHATVIFGQDIALDWLNLDHYPPYLQKLAQDYLFPLNMQYIVTVKPLALRNGMTGSNVKKLQQDMNKIGFNLKEDGEFGNKTNIAVIRFQDTHFLIADGIAGPKTLAKINTLLTPKTLLDAIMQAESGGDDNAEGDINLPSHAYGCLQIRQGVCDSVNAKFGMNYKAQDCLGHREISLDIWNKYWQVFPLIVTDEDRARSWNGGPGWKQIYFKSNKTEKELKYCQNLDIYWSKIKSLL